MTKAEALAVKRSKELDTSWTDYKLVNYGDGEWGLQAHDPKTGDRYTYCEVLGVFSYDPVEVPGWLD